MFKFQEVSQSDFESDFQIEIKLFQCNVNL